MGLHVAAVDLGPEKMALARELGAEIRIDAKTQDPPKEIQKQIGGGAWSVSNRCFNDVFSRLKKGQVNGRVVLSLK